MSATTMTDKPALDAASAFILCGCGEGVDSTGRGKRRKALQFESVLTCCYTMSEAKRLHIKLITRYILQNRGGWHDACREMREPPQ